MSLSAAWAEQAVKAAKKEWGERQLEELEAEERLSVVCERGPVSDPVISQLREAFQVCLYLRSSSPPPSLCLNWQQGLQAVLPSLLQLLWPPTRADSSVEPTSPVKSA